MKKQTQPTLPVWSIGLVVALLLAGYFLYRNTVQTTQVAEIFEAPSEESTIYQDSASTTTNSVGNYALSGLDASSKPKVDEDRLLVKIPKNSPLCFTRKVNDFTYDKNKYYSLKLEGGLADSKGVTSPEESPTKEGSLQWTATFKDASLKAVATTKATTDVWANNVDPSDTTELEFIPPKTHSRKLPARIAQIDFCLAKTTLPVTLNLEGVKLVTKPNPYMGPAVRSN